MRIRSLLMLACTVLIVRRMAAQSDNAAPGALRVPARTCRSPPMSAPSFRSYCGSAQARLGQAWTTGEEWRAEANQLASPDS